MPAGPFGNGAGGVASPISAQRGEVLAEPCDLVGRDVGQGGRRGDDAREDEGGAELEKSLIS